MAHTVNAQSVRTAAPLQNVDSSSNMIVVHDTMGHDRRVQLKEGMISSYKVDDYVRVHLMADLKEAKTINTVR